MRIIFVAFIALLMFSSLEARTFAQYTLPNYQRTYGYISDLISNYTALVNYNYASRADFAIIKGNFSLYHGYGESFKVIVVQSVPNNATILVLIFIPIQGNLPVVILDHNDTFLSLIPNAIAITGEYDVLRNIGFQYGNVEVLLTLAFSIPSTDITGDYQANAKKAANRLFAMDSKLVPAEITTPTTQTSQTIILPITQFISPVIINSTTASATSQSNPLVPMWKIIWAIGVTLATTIVAIFGVLYLYFGNWRDVVKLAGDAGEREEVKTEITKAVQTIARLFGRKKRKEVLKQNAKKDKQDAAKSKKPKK